MALEFSCRTGTSKFVQERRLTFVSFFITCLIQSAENCLPAPTLTISTDLHPAPAPAPTLPPVVEPKSEPKPEEQDFESRTVKMEHKKEVGDDESGDGA